MEIFFQSRPAAAQAQALELAAAQRAAERLLGQAGKENAEVSVVLTGDAEIQTLNQVWRGKNQPTDVLSWPQNESGADEDLLGDVVISVETARHQAAARDWPLDDEIALLLVHGILHLLGHEDDTEAGAERMRRIETEILGQPLEPLPGELADVSVRAGVGTITA